MMILAMLSLMLFSCDNGEQEIIVVPKDYTGYVLIIHNQEDGSPAKYSGEKRVYEIPENGILKTQFKFNHGWREFAEYYYENIGSENELPSFAEIKKVPEDKIVGFMGASGTVKKNADSEERLEFVEFYIGTKAQIKEARKQLEKLDIAKLVE